MARKGSRLIITYNDSPIRKAERYLLIGVSVIAVLNAFALLLVYMNGLWSAKHLLQLGAVYTLLPAIIISLRTKDLLESAQMLFAGFLTGTIVWLFGFFV